MTWELVAEVEKPIAVGELETKIYEGKGLRFPMHRSYEMNLLNKHWNEFIVDMAQRMKEDLLSANGEEFDGIIKHIAGISSMYRLNNGELSGNSLELDVGVTDFKEYVGTTRQALLDQEFGRALMDAGRTDEGDPSYYFANPFATCTNIVTSDGHIPIGMRSEKVVIYPGVPHVIGGYVKVNIDNKRDFELQDIDFFDYMLSELIGEVGLKKDEIVQADFLGIVRDVITCEQEMMYNLVISLTAAELYERWKTKSKDKFEHRDITFYSQKELPGVIEEHKGRMVPTGEANVTLFLKHY